MHQVQDLVLGHHWCLDESPLIAFTARACLNRPELTRHSLASLKIDFQNPQATSRW